MPAPRPTEPSALPTPPRCCVICGGDDRLWEDVDVAARAMGADPLLVARQFWRWFVGRPGSRLPQRPTAVDGSAPIHQPPLANPERTRVSSWPPASEGGPCRSQMSK
jgi:hypothetical protein